MEDVAVKYYLLEQPQRGSPRNGRVSSEKRVVRFSEVVETEPPSLLGTHKDLLIETIEKRLRLAEAVASSESIGKSQAEALTNESQHIYKFDLPAATSGVAFVRRAAVQVGLVLAGPREDEAVRRPWTRRDAAILQKLFVAKEMGELCSSVAVEQQSVDAPKSMRLGQFFAAGRAFSRHWLRPIRLQWGFSFGLHFGMPELLELLLERGGSGRDPGVVLAKSAEEAATKNFGGGTAAADGGGPLYVVRINML